MCDDARRDQRAREPRVGGGRGTRGSFCVTLAAVAPERVAAARAPRPFRRRSGRRESTRRSGRRSDAEPMRAPGGMRARSRSAKGRSARPPRRRSQQAADEWLAAAEAGRRPDAHRRRLQALRDPRLPAGAQPPRPAPPRQQTAHRGQPQRCCRTSPTNSPRRDSPPSSVRNTILPLRAIFRRAHRRGEVAINPTLKPRASPPSADSRDRVAAPTEIAAAPRRPPASRPRDLRHRPLRRTPPRRTPSPPLGQTSTSKQT